MIYHNLLLVINLIFCSWVLYGYVKNRDLLSFVWIIITYYALFILISSFGEIVNEQGYVGTIIKTSEYTKEVVAMFVLSFNILFHVSMVVFGYVWKYLRIDRLKLNKIERYDIAFYVMSFYVIVGGGFYYLQMSGKDYFDYVTMSESAWSQAFLWAGSPAILYFAHRGKYMTSLLLCIPFVVFVLQLKVRSFALLSVVPFIIYMLQNRQQSNALIRNIISSASFILIVYLFLFLRESNTLPDAFLPVYMNTVFEAHESFLKVEGLPGINAYLLNMIRPFLIILGVSDYNYYDTPFYLASIITGSENTVNHFPSLWYTDAYVNYGYIGVTLSILFGFIISLMTVFVRSGYTAYCLFLPYYVWHNYLLIRGAVTIATVPFSYSLYLSAIPIVAIWFYLKLKSK